MNTLNKVNNVLRLVRDQGQIIKLLTQSLNNSKLEQKKLIRRVDNLEKILVDRLQDIFEGDESPLSEIEDRLLKLEGLWRE